MAENELLKQINRELKLTSMENSEKKAAKLKDESDENEDNDKDDEELTLDSESDSDDKEDRKDGKEKLDILNNVDDDVEDIAMEQTDDIKNDTSEFVLSSAPELLNKEDLPVERNEIDEPVDASGILKKYKSDKTSDFIDPDGNDTNENILKVVDTSLGVFTILNYDDKNVLLLDSNKQKIQISINDFNNLHPFEIKDKVLSDINSFSDAYIEDLKKKKQMEKEKEAEENSEEGSEEGNTENETEEEASEEEEEESVGLEDLGGFGESVNRKRIKKEKKNLITEIQKGLSKKSGVVETIRSDVRGKNRCVLVAKKTKTSKDMHMNETRPKASNSMIKPYKVKSDINKSAVLEGKRKKEATQVSDIVQAPRAVFSDDDNFDLTKVLTIKDGKYVLAKLEGKNKTAYLKLLPKKNISIYELKFILNDSKSLSESLRKINRYFTLVEKEIVAMKSKKYEAEEVEDVELESEDDEDLEEMEEDDAVEEKDGDDSSEEEDDEEDEEMESDEDDDSDAEDSIPFSVEINGVRYSGTLYAENDEEDEESDEGDDDDDDSDSEDDDDKDEEDDDYSDLLLQSEDDVEELDFPNDLEEEDGVIEADVKLDNVNYNVKFSNVKEECVKRAKLEMRKHNIIGVWNALVRGSESIKC